MVDVCMLVANEVIRDPRVRKEAATLHDAGYSVAAIGFSREPDPGFVDVDGVKIRRVPRGGAQREIKKAIRDVSPGTYRFLTRHYRRLRGIPDAPPKKSPAAGGRAPARAPTPPTPAEQRENRKRGLLATLAAHDRACRVLAAEAIKLAPKVVHAHDLNTLQAGYWAASATGAALVFDSHELWWQQHAEDVAPRQWVDFYRELEARLIGRCDHVITVCDSIADFLGDRHSIATPTVIRNAIVWDEATALRPADLHAVNQPVQALFHGGFAEHRGLEQLLEAAQSFVGVELVLRGRGPLEEKMKTMIERLGISDRVRFDEPVPMDDVVDAAAQSDIGVVSYQPVCLNNRFSTPNKLFEYLSAGMAIAASDLPEISKIVKQENAGMLFEPESPASIAKTINALAADHKELMRMRINALEGARARHNWSVEEPKLLDVYRALIPRSFGQRARRLAANLRR